MVPLAFPISSSVTRDASLHWKPRSAEIPRQSYKRLPLTRSEKLVEQQFKSGTLSLGIDDIGSAAASDLTGATIDKNKVLISASEDGGDPVAVGFRAKKSNGKYKYYWLYRVKFGIPATNLATKGDSITFSTPTIEGTILRRNKADAGGKHPWKAEALEGDVTAATITNWYKEVYEPTYTTTPEKQG